MPGKGNLETLLAEVRACQVCAKYLPNPPKPVLRATVSARLLIIGQAPGRKVQASGIPWDDASGKRLRTWLGLTEQQFYDEAQIAIIPMGFCYPGTGISGDLPPRPECAPLWHPCLHAALPDLQLTLLIGSYAQGYYLGKSISLTQTVANYTTHLPQYFPLPHPSPRNLGWLKRNPWFEQTTLPALQTTVAGVLR